MRGPLIKSVTLPFNSFGCLLLLLVFLSSCAYTGDIELYEEQYESESGNPNASAAGTDAATGYNPLHNVVRARNYTLDLADRISGLADPEIPAIVAEAKAAAQELDSAMAISGASSSTAHHRLEQALANAGVAARKAYDMAASYGLNPPDVPNVPFFTITFSDVHGTP